MLNAIQRLAYKFNFKRHGQTACRQYFLVTLHSYDDIDMPAYRHYLNYKVQFESYL